MGDLNWKAAVDGDWSTASAWSGNLAPSALDDVTIGLVGNYVVTVTGAAVAASLTFDAPGAMLMQKAGAGLTLSGALTIGNGTVRLGAANTIGGIVFLDSGVLALGHAGAIGSAGLTIGGGMLLGITDMTLVNALALSGAMTIAAAEGTTLELDTQWSIEAGSALEFGAEGSNGTVVLHTDPSSAMGSDVEIRISAGTLRPADDRLYFLTHFSARSTTIDAGATFDASGFRSTFRSLQGEGRIINDGDMAVLSLIGADFAGSIGGALSLSVAGAGVTLTGTNSYTGSTTIDGTTLSLGDGGISGSIAGGSAIGFTANGGSLVIDRSDGYTLANAISGSGRLVQAGTGKTTIERANGHAGGTIVSAGTLAVGHDGALGGGNLTISGGTFLGTKDLTIANAFQMSGTVTIAAERGTTLALDNAGGWGVAVGSTLTFGASGKDGTIVWRTPSSSVIGGDVAVKIAAGTLRVADDRLYYLTDFAARSTTIDAGATVDAAGFRVAFRNLLGEGRIVNDGGMAIISLKGADFAGSISGAFSLNAVGDGVTLTGTNSFTGSTTIDGTTLSLGKGGASGSISSGALSFTVNGGTLVVNRSNAYTLDNAISGIGSLMQAGAGTTSIDRANSYTGGTTIATGTLAIGHGSALGTGALTMTGGTLLVTADLVLANALDLEGAVTIAASQDRLLRLDSSATWQVADGSTLQFGAAGRNGTVVWHANAPAMMGSDVAVVVRAGTLRAGDGSFDTLIGGAARVTVDGGAIIDLAGQDAGITWLQGSGELTSSTAGAALSIAGGSFAGTLDGSFALDVTGSVRLDGDTVVGVGGFTIGQDVTATNGGRFAISDAAGISLSGTAGRFVNIGSFEKSGGSGTGTIAALFRNEGLVEVESGSLRFVGGFTNFGVVKGMLSRSGGVWTVSANAPDQATWFGGSFDNLFTVSSAPTYVDGGAGTDAVEITASMTLGTGSLANVEIVRIRNGVTADLANLTTGLTITLSSAAGGGAAVVGTRGGDSVKGGLGNDRIDGGAGADRMQGGAGDDVYVIDASGDTVTEASGQGIDTVISSIGFTLGADVERLILTGTANSAGTGNSLANTLTGNGGGNLLDGGNGNDTLSGGAGDDELRGGQGDDALGGDAGRDRLAGGLGNDSYVVDDLDTVVEEAGQGIDTVRSGVSVKLGANIENLILTGTAPLTGIGNILANVITGNDGANTLDGGGGTDRLVGGLGNDIYVTDGGDTIVELPNQGNDTVRSSVSMTLGSNLENLILTGGAVAGTGNTLANVITGNGGANMLDGRGGTDRLVGGHGNDVYVTDGGDTIVETAGQGADTVRSSVSTTLAANLENLVLTGTASLVGVGNMLANVMTGNAGANLLEGGLGNDVLTGGAGSDSFQFRSALGPANIDRITDFNVAADTIRIDDAVMPGLGVTLGTLAAAKFWKSTTGLAHDADDRIIYETDTGKLLYDADGSGRSASVHFATLSTNLALTHADFVVI